MYVKSKSSLGGASVRAGAISMLMTKERRPRAEGCAAGRSAFFTKPVRSANARSTAGCRTGPIHTRAIAPYAIAARIRHGHAFLSVDHERSQKHR